MYLLILHVFPPCPPFYITLIEPCCMPGTGMKKWAWLSPDLTKCYAGGKGMAVFRLGPGSIGWLDLASDPFVLRPQREHQGAALKGLRWNQDENWNLTKVMLSESSSDSPISPFWVLLLCGSDSASSYWFLRRKGKSNALIVNVAEWVGSLPPETLNHPQHGCFLGTSAGRKKPEEDPLWSPQTMTRGWLFSI